MCSSFFGFQRNIKLNFVILISLLCLKSARSFMPFDTLKSVALILGETLEPVAYTVSHEEITRRGLLRSVLKFLQEESSLKEDDRDTKNFLDIFYQSAKFCKLKYTIDVNIKMD